MGALVVLEPGLLTTVQDLGREGLSALGIARSGAADTLSLRVANRLAGNPDDAPALEMTLTGGVFRFEEDAVVALAGAPMPASVERSAEGSRAVPPWSSFPVRAGSVLRLGAAPWGVRAYLAVRGGLDVRRVLGSASAHVASGLGGRALAAGDRLLFRGGAGGTEARCLSPDAVLSIEAMLRRESLRVTDGGQAAWFSAASARSFWGSAFTATDRCDRMGIRLEGPVLSSPGFSSMVSEGMPEGAVEVPEAGRAIVLLADRPPTGGYPAIACVASVDHARLGQVRPREAIRFERVTLEEARAAFRERERWFDHEVPAP